MQQVSWLDNDAMVFIFIYQATGAFITDVNAPVIISWEIETCKTVSDPYPNAAAAERTVKVFQMMRKDLDYDARTACCFARTIAEAIESDDLEDLFQSLIYDGGFSVENAYAIVGASVLHLPDMVKKQMEETETYEIGKDLSQQLDALEHSRSYNESHTCSQL